MRLGACEYKDGDGAVGVRCVGISAAGLHSGDSLPTVAVVLWLSIFG